MRTPKGLVPLAVATTTRATHADLAGRFQRARAVQRRLFVNSFTLTVLSEVGNFCLDGTGSCASDDDVAEDLEWYCFSPIGRAKNHAATRPTECLTAVEGPPTCTE